MKMRLGPMISSVREQLMNQEVNCVDKLQEVNCTDM